MSKVSMSYCMVNEYLNIITLDVRSLHSVRHF